MLGFVLFGGFLAAAHAIVCIPELCNGVKQPQLNCAGSVIKNGGFCGCTDICAQVEGEACQASAMFGTPQTLGRCDDGLECKAGLTGNTAFLGAFGRGTCVKSTKVKRATRTKCEQQRMAAMMTMIIYAQKWTPTCDAAGGFTPKQCDFSGECFCVTADGTIQGERTKEAVTCPAA